MNGGVVVNSSNCWYIRRCCAQRGFIDIAHGWVEHSNLRFCYIVDISCIKFYLLRNSGVPFCNKRPDLIKRGEMVGEHIFCVIQESSSQEGSKIHGQKERRKINRRLQVCKETNKKQISIFSTRKFLIFL